MKETHNELYCRTCERTFRTEEREFECPECRSRDIYNSKYLTCDCGTTVYLDGFTNECPECGKLYNGFGQELAPIDEWDDEDRYECFSPEAEPTW